MWTQIKRLVHHRFAKRWTRYLSPAAMQHLTAQVAECEKLHSGEIRICIESSLPPSYLLRSGSLGAIVRQRALSKFGKLRVWDTEHNNGVLIYLLLCERSIELVADRGIDSRVAAQGWQAIVEGLAGDLQQHRFEEGLQQAVAQVSALLLAHFPLQPGQVNRNELPNHPDVDGA